MPYPIWIRLEYRNDVGRIVGFTGSIQSERALRDVLERYEITRENLVLVEINGKSYSPEKLDRFFRRWSSCFYSNMYWFSVYDERAFSLQQTGERYQNWRSKKFNGNTSERRENVMNWSKATLRQLYVIVRYEHCPIRYKQMALKEIQKRLEDLRWVVSRYMAQLSSVT